jgi:hypothetical protein
MQNEEVMFLHPQVLPPELPCIFSRNCKLAVYTESYHLTRLTQDILYINLNSKASRTALKPCIAYLGYINEGLPLQMLVLNKKNDIQTVLT